MKHNRIVDHPVLEKLDERKKVTFTFDGKEYTGYEGDTIAAALLAHGIRTLRVHEESGTPRGIYCNIGHCFECRVTVNDIPGIRACLQEIEEGMVINSSTIQPNPLKRTNESHEIPRTYAEFAKQHKGLKREE